MEYADRTKKMKASEIRELLKITQNPEIISFAGGLPSPHSFPVKMIEKITDSVLERHGAQALQYGPTEGLKELRELLIKRMKKKGIKCEMDEIIITTGSQQVLDLTAKIFFNVGDYLIVECPTYLGALAAFNAYQPNYIPVSMDDDGMKMDELERKLEENKNKPLDIIYTVPTFQNPSGVTMSLERRKRILKIAKKYKLIILEDDPYSELRYSGRSVPPIKSLDKDGIVIYTGTFSKILSPGFRLGWLIANKEIIKKMIIAKQGADLCTNTFVEWIAEEYLRYGLVDKQIPKIRKMYKKKRDIMLKALEKYFPKGTKWTKPDGGMFLWVTLPGHLDTKEMFQEAIKEKVAYVHGAAFCVDGKGHDSMRLNFSNAEDNKIDVGIKRLAKIIKKLMK
ncbi:MAG: aminotransferase class I/II-fold pyridoxal phosphate-dependent enzyme [Candidatus Aenigmarchaeota archaeon]|nr:aminotransferase class I/II-fold pyridoxal phosphate-dependent enzyme [Candidatus Aenigmarchaeota archaeon]